jgi:hypothetical protein
MELACLTQVTLPPLNATLNDCVAQDDADLRPVGSGRDDPNRDPEMPRSPSSRRSACFVTRFCRPDRVKWSLWHPMDILADIMGPHLFNKFKRYMCVIPCRCTSLSRPILARQMSHHVLVRNSIDPVLYRYSCPPLHATRSPVAVHRLIQTTNNPSLAAGPLIGGNVLGAIAGKGLNPPPAPPPAPSS